MLKKIPKILTCLFVIIFVLQLISLLVIAILPATSQAADVRFIPQVGIGEDFKKGDEILVSGDTIGKYIKSIYMYATGIVGILATVVLMFGGISWIAAGGNAQRVDNAKSWITAALTGLFLAMGSYMILNTINPKLIELQPIKPTKPDKLETASTGCCEWPDSVAQESTKSYCEEGADIKGTFYKGYYPLGYYCYAYTANNQPCNDSDKKCKPPLKCINLAATIVNSDDYRCTDGKPGSPCHERSDCMRCNGIVTCEDKICTCT